MVERFLEVVNGFKEVGKVNVVKGRGRGFKLREARVREDRGGVQGL